MSDEQKGDKMIDVEDKKISIDEIVLSFVAWVFMTGVALITIGFIPDAKITGDANLNIVTAGLVLIVWLLGLIWVISVAALWFMSLVNWIVPLCKGLWKLTLHVGNALSALDADISSVMNNERVTSSSSVQIAGDNAVQIQSVGQSHLDQPVFPTYLDDKKELLDALRRRRDGFDKQIVFFKNYNKNDYPELVVHWYTKVGAYQTFGPHLYPDDVELLLTVLRAAQAEYDCQIAILEAQIRNF